MKKSGFKPLYQMIYQSHLKIVKELNNSSIFIQKIIPLINNEITVLKKTKGSDKSYKVPIIKANKNSTEAFRTDLEVKAILTNLADRELYENLLVANVSKFEAYLFGTLKDVIKAYPEKLNINIQGISSVKSVPVDIIFNVETKDEIFDYLIREKITAISYAKPSDYIKFVGQVLSINTDSDVFSNYIEIKATRDILIHNSGIVNDVYISKAGLSARSEIGTTLVVDEKYFNFCIGVMKAISGIIRKDTLKVFN